MVALLPLTAACEPDPDVQCQQAVDRRTQAESEFVAADLAYRSMATPRPNRQGIVQARDAQSLDDAAARVAEAQRQFDAARAAVGRYCDNR